MKRFIYILFLFACVSCNPDEIGPQSDLDFLAGNPQGVLISNEGNFNFGNASLSFYDPYSNETSHQIYKQVNGEDLGDVLQDVVLSGDQIYMVLNNSQKLIITNKNLEKIREIQGLDSPRHIGIINTEKAYITDLYSDEIAIVNLEDGVKTGTIPCEGWTEKIFIVGGFAFVINKTQNSIYKIATSSDQLVASSSIACESILSVVQSDEDQLSMIVDDFQGTEDTYLLHFSLTNLSVSSSILLSNTDTSAPNYLCSGRDEDDHLFISYYDEGIRKLIKSQGEWMTPELVWSSDVDAYSLDWNDEHKEYYLSDPINFVQSGKVYRMKGNGEVIDVIDAGSIPNGVVFNN